MHVEQLKSRFPDQNWCACNPSRDAHATESKKTIERQALQALQNVAQKHTSYSAGVAESEHSSGATVPPLSFPGLMSSAL